VLAAAALLCAGGVGFALTTRTDPPSGPSPDVPRDPLQALREAAERTRLRLKRDTVRWNTRHSLQGDYEVLTGNSASPGRVERRLETIDNGRQALSLEYVEQDGLWEVSWPELVQRHHRRYEAPLDPPELYADLHRSRLQLYEPRLQEQLGALRRVENGIAVFGLEAPAAHLRAVELRLQHPEFRIRERALVRRQQLLAGIEHHFDLEHGWLIRLRGPDLDLQFEIAWTEGSASSAPNEQAHADPLSTITPVAATGSARSPISSAAAQQASPSAAAASTNSATNNATNNAIATETGEAATTTRAAANPERGGVGAADDAAARTLVASPGDPSASSDRTVPEISPASRSGYPLLASRCWGTDYRQPCEDDAILLPQTGGTTVRRPPVTGTALPIGYLPDGRHLVVLSDDLRGRRAFLLELNSGQATPLGGEQLGWGYTVSGALSPDGQRLVLGHQLVRGDTVTQHYLAALDGEAIPVGKPLPAAEAAWLRDGSALVLGMPDARVLRLGLDGAVSELAAGTQPVPLDAQTLLLRRNGRLHTLQLSSGRARLFADGLPSHGRPAVSPDGQELLFLFQDGFRFVGESVSLASPEQRRRLSLPPGRFRHPLWR